MPPHRSTSTTSTCQPPPSGVRRPRSAPSPARGRSDLLGSVAVGVGDYFHHVTVGVLEIDAATGVQMIDLAGLGAPRIGVIPDALSADAGERRVELDVADKERVMPRTKLFARIEIEGHAVRRFDRDEMAPFRPRLEIEDIGEELGRYPFVLRRDDRVIEFDTHLVLPSRFVILSRHWHGRGGPCRVRPQRHMGIRFAEDSALPFLDTFRTICLAPQPEFRRLLEQARDLPIAA